MLKGILTFKKLSHSEPSENTSSLIGSERYETIRLFFNPFAG